MIRRLASCKRTSALVLLMVLFLGSGTAAVVDTDIKVLIDGTTVFFPDQKPLIDTNNRTLVPVRFVAEGLGADVEWCDEQKQVIITYAHETVTLTIGSLKVQRDGDSAKAAVMDTLPTLQSGRVMVPLRFISETMGYKVDWVEETRHILISSRSQEPLFAEAAVARIDSVSWPDGVAYPGQQVQTDITLTLIGREQACLWLELGFKDQLGTWYDVAAKPVQIIGNTPSQHSITWCIPEGAVGGRYNASLTLWSDDPAKGTAKRLDEIVDLEGILVYRHIEPFASIDTAIWQIPNTYLERTFLRRRNVRAEDGKLMILLPQNTLEGGEIYTKNKQGYGAYEIRMKLPDAPSSITGFFLYSQPSLYNEIDIEIYNQADGEFFLTTYAGGEKVNLFEGNLGFDPTAGFNDYRIEYYPHKVAFYANDLLLLEWREGFSHERMHLMLNVWYPDWLAGTPPALDRYLYVDWIRY